MGSPPQHKHSKAQLTQREHKTRTTSPKLNSTEFLHARRASHHETRDTTSRSRVSARNSAASAAHRANHSCPPTRSPAPLPLLASCTYYSVFSYPYYFIPAQAQGPPRAIAAFLPILIPVVQLQDGRVTDTGGRDPRYCCGEKVQSSLLDLPLNYS